MKDLPHHLKKLNRRVLRSEHREVLAQEGEETPQPLFPKSAQQKKKQAKLQRRQKHESHTPMPLTAEERNKKMLHRVPVFDRQNNAKPKSGARPSKKKMPRI